MPTKILNGTQVPMSAAEIAERVSATGAEPTSEDVMQELAFRSTLGTDIAVTGLGVIPVSGSAEVQADLTALVSAAQLSAANPAAVFPFRDQAGVIHTLSPAQVQELYLKGLAFISELRKSAWTLIDTPGGIPANYKEEVHWV